MSTAALTHDQGLPLDAEPLLQEGYFCTVLDTPRTTHFNLVHKDRPYARLAQVSVQKSQRSYTGQYRRSFIYISSSVGELTPAVAVCLGELLAMAAVFTEALDHDLEATQRAEEERQRKEREKLEAQRKAEREERIRLAAEQEKALEPLKEFLKWNLDEKIRYKKRYARSVVFGTVNKLDHNWSGRTQLYTTSERGRPMNVPLTEILWLEHQPEGQKKYERIYTNPDQTGLTS